jgi:protein-tyrosine phosphatase
LQCGDLDDDLGKIDADSDSDSDKDRAERRAAPPPDAAKRPTHSARRLGNHRGGGGGLKRPLNSAPTLGRNGGAKYEQGLDGLLPGGVYVPRGALGGRDMGVIGMGRYDEMEANVEAKHKRAGGRKHGGFFAQPPPSRVSGNGPIASRFFIPRFRGEVGQGEDRGGGEAGAGGGGGGGGGVDLVDDLEGLPAEIAAARLRRRHQCKHYAGFQRICDGIYLGPASVSQMLAPLQDAGITHVLNVTDTEPCAFPQHFKYFTVPVQDTSTERLEPFFAAAFSFMSRAVAGGGKVFIHCVQGVSRSASMVLYFMMRSLDMSLLDAFKQVRDARACAHPNVNFWGQLAREEVKLRGECSCSVHQYQVRKYRHVPKTHTLGMVV